MQADASRCKFNLRTDLRWVVKQARKFTCKCTQVLKKICVNAALRFNIWSKQENVHWLALGGQAAKNLRWLGANLTPTKLNASLQVIASQGTCTQGLAKRKHKYTQVWNLRLPASPFGQDLKFNGTAIKHDAGVNLSIKNIYLGDNTVDTGKYT